MVMQPYPYKQKVCDYIFSFPHQERTVCIFGNYYSCILPADTYQQAQDTPLTLKNSMYQYHSTGLEISILIPNSDSSCGRTNEETTTKILTTNGVLFWGIFFALKNRHPPLFFRRVYYKKALQF